MDRDVLYVLLIAKRVSSSSAEPRKIAGSLRMVVDFLRALIVFCRHSASRNRISEIMLLCIALWSISSNQTPLFATDWWILSFKFHTNNSCIDIQNWGPPYRQILVNKHVIIWTNLKTRWCCKFLPTISWAWTHSDRTLSPFRANHLRQVFSHTRIYTGCASITKPHRQFCWGWIIIACRLYRAPPTAHA